MVKLKNIATILFVLAASLSASADNYIVIGREAKVFDEPDATGYVTLNTKNKEVVLQPGMVFKTFDESKGWFIIEYSPGLRGYLSEQARTSVKTPPEAGTYSVANNPSQKLNVTKTGHKWTAKTHDKQYSGEVFENVVVFFDDKKNPAFSLVNLSSGPVVMTYDNSVTKFF